MGEGFNFPRKWTLRQRLDEGMDRSGGSDACWPWMRARLPKGYGLMYWHKGMQLTHRLSYCEAKGLVAPDRKLLLDPSILVLHDCDNPPCGNPAHLHEGDKVRNYEEAVERGLQWAVRGEDQPAAKLTEAQVLAIRADPRSHREIARDYDVGKTIIGSIKSRKKWGWL